MLSKQLFDSSFHKCSPASKGAQPNPLHARRGQRRTLLWVVHDGSVLQPEFLPRAPSLCSYQPFPSHFSRAAEPLEGKRLRETARVRLQHPCIPPLLHPSKQVPALHPAVPWSLLVRPWVQ